MHGKIKFKFEYIAAAIVFALQMIIVYNAQFITGWDSEICIENAHYLVTEHTYLYPEYFSQCPNNLFIMYIWTLIKWVVGSITFDDWLLSFRVILYFQCFLNSVSGLLLFKICEFRANRFVAWTGYVFYMALVGFSPYMLIAYSDALGVIFPTLILFIYFFMVVRKPAPKTDESENGEKKEKKNSAKQIVREDILPFALLGSVAAVAYNIKPQPVIVFIAIAGISILTDLISRKYIRLISKTITMVVAFLLVFLAIKIPIYYNNSYINKDAGFGMTHYLMLGANTESMGGYNDGDVYFSRSYATRELRSKANIEEYKRRVSELGPDGYIKYLGNKLYYVLSDGEFGWPPYTVNGELVNTYFFRSVLGEPKNMLALKIRAAMYWESRSHKFLTKVRNIFWFVTLMLSFVGIFLLKNDSNKAVLYLSILGFILFSVLFEGAPRYAFVFAEVFIITAMQTVYSIILQVKKDKAVIATEND